MGEAILFFIIGIFLLLASVAIKYAEPPSEELRKMIPRSEKIMSKTSLGCMVGFGTLLLRFSAIICFVNALLLFFST